MQIFNSMLQLEIAANTTNEIGFSYVSSKTKLPEFHYAHHFEGLF